MKLFSVLGLALVACGGGGGTANDGDFVAAASAVVGIYGVNEHTRNDTACTPDGEPFGGSDTFAVAFQERFFGIDLLTVMSCAEPQDCRDKVANRDGIVAFDFAYSVEELGDGAELVGGGGSTGFGQDGICTQGEVFSTVLTLTGDQLRIEQRITVADDYPADSDGFCTTDGAREAAEGKPCSAMEVLAATFVEEL